MNSAHGINGPIKSVRVPRSDVEAAKLVTPPRFITTENSMRFAVMGTAILEKLCRSGKLSVYAKRTTPYILNTARGKTALSVMVSAVKGSLETKHMVVPLTSIPVPDGVVNHVIVCAFVSKYERTRESHGGINVKLAGWATAEEALRHAYTQSRVATCVAVAAIPVGELHPIQTLRHYLAPDRKETRQHETNAHQDNAPRDDGTSGDGSETEERTCVSPASDASLNTSGRQP